MNENCHRCAVIKLVLLRWEDYWKIEYKGGTKPMIRVFFFHVTSGEDISRNPMLVDLSPKKVLDNSPGS